MKLTRLTPLELPTPSTRVSSPIPRPELASTSDEESLAPRPLAIVALFGAVLGGSLGYWMQYFTEVTQYPRMVADRPPHSWPAFIPVTFEMCILGAATAMFFAFFIRTRLPQLHHAVFDVPGFERASQDQFFLELKLTATSPFVLDAIRTLGAVEVTPVIY